MRGGPGAEGGGGTPLPAAGTALPPSQRTGVHGPRPPASLGRGRHAPVAPRASAARAWIFPIAQSGLTPLPQPLSAPARHPSGATPADPAPHTGREPLREPLQSRRTQQWTWHTDSAGTKPLPGTHTEHGSLRERLQPRRTQQWTWQYGSCRDKPLLGTRTYRTRAPCGSDLSRRTKRWGRMPSPRARAGSPSTHAHPRSAHPPPRLRFGAAAGTSPWPARTVATAIATSPPTRRRRSASLSAEAFRLVVARRRM